ncbi:protein STICHEL-like [Musa acuminata AAA Group]|uniref:protein STICHEL-like n=1 Tax=Musa acuminata AAA Group TaxID=214697 RepID=UPI0031DD5834
MLKTSVGPSELHLKRELTALQRERFLRDPETCSSWRSPLSSKSFVANSKVKNGNGMMENFIGEINYSSPLNVSLRGRNGRQNRYLYNLRHHTTERVRKLDEEDRDDLVKGSPKDNTTLSNSLIEDSKSDTCLGIPVNFHNVTSTYSGNPVRRNIREFRRTISVRGMTKHPTVSKLMGTASCSLGIIDSGEQSDDGEDYNSEDLQQLVHELTQQDGYISHSSSPLLYGSGFGSRLSSSKFHRTCRTLLSSQSCTPASTSSYYKYGGRDTSTVGSCNGTVASFDVDELDQPELSKVQRCGIPCYWPKRTKDMGVGGLSSPSLSDTLKKRGSGILCGSQHSLKKKLSGCHKQSYLAKSSQGLPLLTNSCDIGQLSLDTTSDELSSKLGELDLEARSRLDGRRWSSCKSQEGLQTDMPGGAAFDIVDQRSLSQKYQPRFFQEIIGQNIVIQSLGNAISRGRIAPAYLFHGPRGTGKTSAAKIFAAALNCLSIEENKPCWFCRECTAFSSRNGTSLKEVNATNKMSIDQVRHLLKSLSLAKTISQCKVFVIDECHLLSSKNWSMFMKFLEEPLPRIVFIFITIEPGSLPHSIMSRCQKYIFSKVKDVDIVCRLKKLSIKENLDVELDALNLIALNSNGSLRDAEIMLDQLSLLGKRITSSLVIDLVGVVPGEKLLELLEIAMSSDTAETVKRSRELIDSGIDPIALMSQLAGLIMDRIAGTYRMTKSNSGGTALGGQSLTEAELERLQLALKILSDAEKQLRHSSERSTWFTAALLQLGSAHNLELNRISSSSTSSKRNAIKNSNTVSSMEKNSPFCENRRSHERILIDSGQTNDATCKEIFRSANPENLDEIWTMCIHRCHSQTLRQLLSTSGRLLSITENEGTLIAFIGFEDSIIKSRAQRFLSSITNSMEIVLRQNVDVRLGVVPEGLRSMPSLVSNQMEKDKQRKVDSDNLSSHSNQERIHANKILDSYERISEKSYEQCDRSAPGDSNDAVTSIPMLLSERKNGSYNNKDKGQGVSAQGPLKMGPDEQRLETAWLQAADPRIVNQSKLDMNQVLPLNGVNHQCVKQSSIVTVKSTRHWDDELDDKVRYLKVSATGGHNKKRIEGADHYATSPSLLHCNKKSVNCEKENKEYKPRPCCIGLHCWTTPKNQEKKVKHGIRVESPKASHFLCLRQCGKLKSAESRFRK